MMMDGGEGDNERLLCLCLIMLSKTFVGGVSLCTEIHETDDLFNRFLALQRGAQGNPRDRYLTPGPGEPHHKLQVVGLCPRAPKTYSERSSAINGPDNIIVLTKTAVLVRTELGPARVPPRH